MKKKAKKIFFISPVRLATPENLKDAEEYVKKLERDGHIVHWPIRDTNQIDPTLGINICDTNLKKILEYDEIHVYYFNSTGIHFDLGATYLLIKILNYRKKVVFVNGNKKEFEKNFVSGEALRMLRALLRADVIPIIYAKEDMVGHFFLGATYMLIRILNYKKKVVFTNKFEFAKEIAEKNVKAFFQVLNFLDENTNPPSPKAAAGQGR